MTGRDLAREYGAAVAALTKPDHQRLIAADVDAELIAIPELVGLTCIRVCGGELYEPDPHGGPAYLTPVLVDPDTFGDSPESPYPAITLRYGALVDIVAWRPDRQAVWALRTGTASWLGAIEPQYCAPLPVRVWRDPLGWLRAGCNGLVLLTHDAPEAYRILSTCRGGIEAEDERHAAELRAILARPYPAPGLGRSSSTPPCRVMAIRWSPIRSRTLTRASPRRCAEAASSR